MATPGAHKRLTREYANIQRDPPPYITAHPSESNILEWHYILTGAPNTPYHNGQYWGSLVFPPDYPFSPPAIRMHTPSGRFRPSERLCLSISDFHPKSFNPAWSVATILNGLLSFMNGDEMTAGSISHSPAERRYFAARSRWWNSTGGGTATNPYSAEVKSGVARTTRGLGGIKAGDGGLKFRAEWPDEDKDNWEWMEENKIDAKTGKCLPIEDSECSSEMVRIRKILGGGGTDLARTSALHGAGEGFIRQRIWWIVGGCFIVYVLVSRILGLSVD